MSWLGQRSPSPLTQGLRSPHAQLSSHLLLRGDLFLCNISHIARVGCFHFQADEVIR